MLHQLFPINSRTLRHFLSVAELSIIDKVALHEQMFGRALPGNSFYKAIAIAACKRGEQRFVEA